MTKNILITLFLTLTASACTITPTEANDQSTDPNDQTTDPNDPSNCEPTDPITQPSCPEVSACDDVAADCTLQYTHDCGSVARGRFTCGELHGYFFTDGTEVLCDGFLCPDEFAYVEQHCSALAE
jgi:hypothetical protein